jgi:hypothetical protein
LGGEAATLHAAEQAEEAPDSREADARLERTPQDIRDLSGEEVEAYIREWLAEDAGRHPPGLTATLARSA